MPIVHVRGVDLYYEEHGVGPAIIVAHGTLGSVASAPHFGLRVADIANQGFRVVSYDARGHGRSGYTEGPADYEWTSLADDMLALMDALGIERASVCGTSMGAGTALMLALTRPERVERLILRSPPPFEIDIAAACRKMSGLALLYRWLGARWTARVATIFGGGSGPGAMRDLLAAQRAAAIVPAIRGLLLEGPPLPLERMDEIRAPSLVLAHAGDSLHPLRSGEMLRDRLAIATLYVAPSPTHWQDDPNALTRIIVTFVKAPAVSSEPRAPLRLDHP